MGFCASPLIHRQVSQQPFIGCRVGGVKNVVIPFLGLFKPLMSIERIRHQEGNVEKYLPEIKSKGTIKIQLFTVRGIGKTCRREAIET